MSEANSAHEGFAVILEELDELKTEVWRKQSKRWPKKMRQEAVQIAVMAMRFAWRCAVANDLIVVQSGVSVDRIDVMDWFKAVNLEQARDVFHVVEGILEMRRQTVPKRKRRDLDPARRGCRRA